MEWKEMRFKSTIDPEYNRGGFMSKSFLLKWVEPKQPLPKETVIFHGKDITGQVEEAWNFLVEHAFVM